MKKTLDFDTLKTEIDVFGGKPIAAFIQNKGREYLFYKLKPIVSFNTDVCGVGLNHAFQPQKTHRSKFHDNEDICIDFRRDEFVDAQKSDSDKTYLHIWTLTFYCQLSVEKSPM